MKLILIIQMKKLPKNLHIIKFLHYVTIWKPKNLVNKDGDKNTILQMIL